MNPGRNEPCPCGSGKKYKNCCNVKAGPVSRHKSLVLAAGVLVIGGGIWLGQAFLSSDSGSSRSTQPEGAAPPGKVWSAEHGHYHDAATGRSLPEPGQAGTSQPEGAAPAGKVWSAEHGHYHDAPPGQIQADSAQTDAP